MVLQCNYVSVRAIFTWHLLDIDRLKKGGVEVLGKWWGEGVKAIRKYFRNAVLFLQNFIITWTS